MKEIASFIEALRNDQNLKNAFNPYVQEHCHSNLQRYLLRMHSLQPKVVLVGEAPGYLGCRLTGIPFSSEHIIRNHSFFRYDPYQLNNQTQKLQKEASATIVWNVLDKYPDCIPLIWNIYPFHPFKDGNEKSNRAPLKAELDEGRKILKQLLVLFDIEKIITVGNKAKEGLKKEHFPNKIIVPVRHPSHGGKADFVKGIKQYLS